MAEESKPLIVRGEPASKTGADRQLQSVAVTSNEPEMIREWDGPLWKMCGDCDQAGLSTFAYVKMCTPLAWGHNFQRAFGWGFWKHAMVFMLLFFVWGVVLTGHTSRMGAACGPHPPHPPHHPPHDPLPKPQELPPLHTDPEQQQFLAGATWNPSLVEQTTPDEEEEGTWVTIEGADQGAKLEDSEQQPINNLDNNLSQNRDIMSQIQDAKNKATENLVQFGVGRKLLHKHKHDDDDDDDDDHKHKHHKGDHKQKHHDEDEREHGPPEEREGPDFESPECYDAMVNVGALVVATFISTVIGIIYASKVRTAIRMRHGIKGSKWRDCLAWTFCAPCALCQESRTLARHNVHEGVWYGETVLPVQSLHKLGQAQLQAPKQIEAPTKPV